MEVIKKYALSKINYPATVLTVPCDVSKIIKDIVYNYLWGEGTMLKDEMCVKTLKKVG